MSDVIDPRGGRGWQEQALRLRDWPQSFEDAKAPRRDAEHPAPGLPGGRVVVMTQSELQAHARWTQTLATERKDHRYYGIVERTIAGPFEHRYFALTDDRGEVRAIQPFFIHDQDLLTGLRGRMAGLVSIVRRFWPRFLRMRTLMVGCVAGEGHVDGDNETARRANAGLLASSIVEQARALKTSLIVLKEFPARYRDTLAPFRARQFTRVPSLPMTRMSLAHASFDDFMRRALSRIARKDLRRKFRAAARAPAIEMSVMTDVSAIVDELYPLYLQVYERSHLHFEKLTKEYLCELGRRMPDRARFFVWRQNGRIVAFNLCLVHEDTIYDEYIGLDYAVALDLHLYHYTIRDVFNWAVANGYRWSRSNGLSYEPKLHLRSELEPLDLYVRHPSRVANVVLKIALPLLEPTRYDQTLRRFPNYRDLWGDR